MSRVELYQRILAVKPAVILLCFAIFSTTACGQNDDYDSGKSSGGEYNFKVLTGGLDHPWGMDFLPDGRLLVTERSGQLRTVLDDTVLGTPIQGVPEVISNGQGGMLDVAIDPDFEENQLVYLSYSEPRDGGRSATALGRGRLILGELKNFEVLFRQEPAHDGSAHFGSRIIFHNGYLYLTTGERFQFDPAQDLSTHLGKIIRIKPDGSVPPNNPFVNDDNAEDEIWTYGHRNIESAAIDPLTGNLWIAEMGPSGGDELNLIKRGENYGWPEVSWGKHYNGGDIPDPDTRPEFTDAVVHWTPVISPSGMEFYSGKMFGEWENHMLIGGLSSQAMVIVKVEGNEATEVERIAIGSRVRDVAEAPDGSIYLLTDKTDGEVLRMYR